MQAQRRIAMNTIVKRSLISKLRMLSPPQVAEVEGFVEFLAAKNCKQQALDRLLAVSPAIEAANAVAGSKGHSEAGIAAEALAVHRRGVLALRGAGRGLEDKDPAATVVKLRDEWGAP